MELGDKMRLSLRERLVGMCVIYGVCNYMYLLAFHYLSHTPLYRFLGHVVAPVVATICPILLSREEEEDTIFIPVLD